MWEPVSVRFQSTPSAWRETGLWHKHFGIPEQFQSTPSAWRETQLEVKVEQDRPISIHSLRMEGDLPFLSFLSNFLYFNPLPPHGGRPLFYLHLCTSQMYFNPLPPHGGRLLCLTFGQTLTTFQSTPSAWRETDCREQYTRASFISIHSLRMEGDFQQRPMCAAPSISIHSLRMEGDLLYNHADCEK